MRIVGGEFRGRKLAAPVGDDIRPSSERLRETLFDILLHRYREKIQGAHVLDLFAGSGALGLEAISRGAVHALFVDQGVEARGLLRANIETLGLTGRTRIFRRDATKLGPAGNVGPFELVFADPPYGQGLAEQALAAAGQGGYLASGALCVVEESFKSGPAPQAGFELLEARRIGDSILTFFSFVGNTGKVQAPLSDSPKC